MKKDIEDLRKEKAVIELKLDDITEEFYSLRRWFWKERNLGIQIVTATEKRSGSTSRCSFISSFGGGI